MPKTSRLASLLSIPPRYSCTLPHLYLVVYSSSLCEMHSVLWKKAHCKSVASAWLLGYGYSSLVERTVSAALNQIFMKSVLVGAE